MSRIGYTPVELPEGTEIKVSGTNEVTVKGPKGELIQQVDPDITIKVEDNTVLVERPTNQKRHKAMHGLYRALIANMVEGVTEGYKKQLELVGVGYRATAQGQVLDLAVGYSHGIVVELPPEVKVAAETAKGQNPVVTLESTDKQLLGQIASKIRSLRPPEPYKGKGIRYVDEYVRRKAGKAAVKE